MPPEVKSYIVGLLKGKQEHKTKMVNRMKEIRAELRGQLNVQTTGVEEEYDDDDVDDITFPPGMDPYQKKEYREAIRASKQTKWERSHLHKLHLGLKRVSLVVMLDQR